VAQDLPAFSFQAETYYWGTRMGNRLEIRSDGAPLSTEVKCVEYTGGSLKGEITRRRAQNRVHCTTQVQMSLRIHSQRCAISYFFRMYGWFDQWAESSQLNARASLTVNIRSVLLEKLDKIFFGPVQDCNLIYGRGLGQRRDL
jgi:hypothetical protein